MREPAQPGDTFKVNAMLDSPKRILHPPALMVERAEFSGRPAVGVEQIGREHTYTAVGRHNTDQANRDRSTFQFVVGCIRAIGWRQGDDRLRRAATQERCHGLAADAVDAHAEPDGARLKCGHQPRGGVAAVKHEQIMFAQQLEMLEQHLPLAGIGAVQRCPQHHLDARQVQGEDFGATDHAPRGIPGGKAHVTGVGGYHTQAVPARYTHVLFDEREQTLRQIDEHRLWQILAGLRKGLRAHAADQFGLVVQHGEETVQFSLHAGAVAADEPANERDEIEHAPTAEMPCIGDMARAQLGGMEVSDELVQYRVNPSSYREIFRMTTIRILPAQPRVYKARALKLRGLYTNLASMVPADASSLYARNLLDFLKLIITKEGALNIDLADDIVAATLLARDGAVTRKA